VDVLCGSCHKEFTNDNVDDKLENYEGWPSHCRKKSESISSNNTVRHHLTLATRIQPLSRETRNTNYCNVYWCNFDMTLYIYFFLILTVHVHLYAFLCCILDCKQICYLSGSMFCYYNYTSTLSPHL